MRTFSTKVLNSDFMNLVHARRGHFQLESGYHSALWLDLDALFVEPQRIAPLVHTLVAKLAPYNATAVCGPLLGGAFLAQLVAHELKTEFWYTMREMPEKSEGLFQARYVLPPALEARVSGAQVAIVDDVMSAGSALRGTYMQVQAHGADTVVVGALASLGDNGADYFATQNVPVETVWHEHFEMWKPEECPLCAAGIPLETGVSG